MTEIRCPTCEALIVELECLECVWHQRHGQAVRVVGVMFGSPMPPTTTYCRNGHEMTEENTKLEPRENCMSKICRTCRNQRRAKKKAQQTAGIDGGQQPPLKTHCRNGHEMTPKNSRTDGLVAGNTATIRCKACHNQRRVEKRAENKAKLLEATQAT